MRRALPLLAAALLALTPLLPLRYPLTIWPSPYQTGSCIGPCCLITSPFLEFSCGEYRHL